MKIRDILRENQERDLTYLKGIKGWDETYDDDFYVDGMRLTSLNGAPSERVSGNFYCGNNELTTLKGAPVKIAGDFFCYNNKLTSLEGAPIRIGGRFVCHDNPITSLTGIGSYFKNGYIKNDLKMPDSIKSHILGTLLIPELRGITTSRFGSHDLLVEAIKIINKHFRSGKDILECQEELRSAGLREYGKL